MPSQTNIDSILQITTYTLAYLDLEFFLNDKKKLEFQFRRIENQNLKFLNKNITYTNATFKEISCGIFNRLAKFTSSMGKNSRMKMIKRYPGHANDLIKSGLAPKLIPSFKKFEVNYTLQN